MTYIEELENAVVKLHGAEALYLGSSSVEETFKGKTIWKGIVSTFELTDHPTAKRAFAWGVPKDENDPSKGWEITTVLERPPVDSPETAVKIAIAAQIRAQQQPPR